jgi:hypothetical protein
MNNRINTLKIEKIRLNTALAENYLSIFHSRDEIKAVLAQYLEIASLDEARDYILPRLGFLTKQEANQLLLTILDEMLEEGRIIHDCREAISSREG